MYVSSTFRDLTEFRKKVIETIRRMGLVDVAMEHYNAQSDPPSKVCVDDVRACDVYVGIVAWRYGDIPPGETSSITESEYRAAVEAEKICLIFLLQGDEPWPPPLMDDDLTRVKRFRAELLQRRLAVQFRNPDELGKLVATALYNEIAKAGGGASSRVGLEPALVASYHRRLDQEYSGLDLAALTPPKYYEDDGQPVRLQAVFVEPDVRADPPPVEVPRELLQRLQTAGEIDETSLPDGFSLQDLRAAQEAYRAKPRTPVLAAVTADRCLVVLGDPGAGKSTLARLLVLDLIAPVPVRVPKLAGHLPVLVELREYTAARARGVRSVLDFVHERKDSGLGLPRQVLESYLKAGGPALVVFDGLDEVFDPSERIEITRQIATLAEDHPTARVLVTSRTWGYERHRLTAAGFAHHTLQDLDRAQIEEFLTGWYHRVLAERVQEAAHRRTRLLEAIDASRPILELAGNPLLLTVLAIIGKGQQLPRERWKAYEQATWVLVENWDVSRQLRAKGVAPDFITEDDKRELLRRLAWAMQTGKFGKAGNFVHRDELQRLFEEYLVDSYQKSPTEAKTVAVVMIEQFRHRDFILSRWGPDLYAFVHRAFLEFFCADAVLRRFQHLQTMSLDDLGELYLERCDDPTWHEILRLLASRLAEPHTAVLLQQLMDADRPWPAKEFDQPPHGLRLAVQCLAEMRNLHGVPGLAKAAEAVLTEVIFLLEHCVGLEDSQATSMIMDDVLPVVRIIGADWPGRDVYADWYARRGAYLLWAPITEFAVQLLANLFHDTPRRLLTAQPLSTTSDDRATEALRAGAYELSALPPIDTGGEDIGPILHANLARTSDRWSARLFALVLLDRFAPDGPGVDAVLRDRLVHDDNADVFAVVAAALLRRHPVDDAGILDIITTRATDPDPDPDSGRFGPGRFAAAVRVLAAQRPDHPFALIGAGIEDGLLEWDEEISVRLGRLRAAADPGAVVAVLRTMATAADSYQVRHNALVLLDRFAPDDPGIDAVLRDRLVNDDDDDVFAVVAAALLRRHPVDDADILDIITTRATDPDSDSDSGRFGPGRFAAAVRVLAAQRPDHPFALIGAGIEDGLLEWDEEISVRLGRLRAAADPGAVVAVLRTMATTADSYQVRHNALVLLDRFAPDDPGVDAVLRDRLVNDDNADVFAVVAAALLRRHPVDDADILDIITTRATGPDSGRFDSGRFATAAVRVLAAQRPETGRQLTRDRLGALPRPDPSELPTITYLVSGEVLPTGARPGLSGSTVQPESGLGPAAS